MKYLLMVLMVLPTVLPAQDKKFSITGNISGLADGSGVSLTYINNPTDTVAKATVAKGRFVLAGSVQEPNLYQLNMDAVQKKSILFIGNETITIQGNTDNVQELQVKGSAVHDDFIAFQNIFNPLFRSLGTMNQQLASRPDIGRDDSLMIAYQKAYNEIFSAIDTFIKNKKSSPVSAFLLLVTRELEQDPANLQKRYNLLAADAQQSFYGKLLHNDIVKASVGTIGSEAVDFIQADTAGKPVSLASFRGKYVLIDFWASWCRPCRMENPNVVSAYQKFRDKNFTVLGVSLDRSREPWLQAIAEDGLVWTQVSDLKFWQNEVARKYNIESIPQNFLVDPDGKIVAKNLRGPALEARLCELLGCN